MIEPTLWPTYTPPSRSPVSGPTKIPTEMPIPPPEPLDYPSDDLTDHWFCGGSIYEANTECSLHCPTAMECPIDQICFFGTKCDARTHLPTPPPSRRPTRPPTEYPTTSPTETAVPTPIPTETMPPSNTPTEQIPTRSPTTSPTKRPTYAPMPSLMSSFYCGVDWNDAVTNCKKKCPSSDDTECPDGEHCYSLTPCTEEMGYPDSFYESDENTSSSGGGGNSANDGACVPLIVTITADYWPKENSWIVENTETGEIIAEGNNDILVPDEAVRYPVECINNKLGCYLFTIKDTGGDGLCCEHGSGSYTVSYDDEVIKTGTSFYDNEKVSFGLCGETQVPTAPPTKEPTISSSANTVNDGENTSENYVGSTGGTAFRCLPQALIQGEYSITVDHCMNFVDCYNSHIKVGDDWFCDEDAECVEAPHCSGDVDNAVSLSVAGGSYRCVADELAEKGYIVSREKCDFFDPCYNTFIREGDQFFCNEGFSCISAVECGDEEEGEPVGGETEANPPPSPPRPSPIAVATTNETMKPTNKTPMSEESVSRPAVAVTRPPRPTNTPTQVPTESAAPTFEPTTYRPTHGPCSGEACYTRDHCRSQYGFCGSGEIYCNSDAIWTKDCPRIQPSPPPTFAPPPSNSPMTSVQITFVTEPPSQAKLKTEEPTVGTSEQLSPPPSTQKPVWVKPGVNAKPKPSGGKPKPSLTKPSTPRPTKAVPVEETNEPQPTMQPTSSPHSLIDTFLMNNSQTPKTSNPTGISTAKPVLPTMYTKVRTNSPSVSPSDEVPTNELECTGDPCPVETHCRSRYNSCGPGFIYCNTQSIWTNDCPPFIPGVSPTRNPTRKPTKSPSTVAEPSPTLALGIPNIVLDRAEPTFPPLPGPTLPTISEGNPLSPSFFDIFLTANEKDEAENEAKSEDKNTASFSADFSPVETNAFESDAYLDAWIKARDSSGAKSNTFICNADSKLMCGIVLCFFAMLIR